VANKEARARQHRAADLHHQQPCARIGIRIRRPRERNQQKTNLPYPANGEYQPSRLVQGLSPVRD
jgi:hypothetical protein